jgi:hypothetical protein
VSFFVRQDEKNKIQQIKPIKPIKPLD